MDPTSGGVIRIPRAVWYPAHPPSPKAATSAANTAPSLASDTAPTLAGDTAPTLAGDTAPKLVDPAAPATSPAPSAPSAVSTTPLQQRRNPNRAASSSRRRIPVSRSETEMGDGVLQGRTAQCPALKMSDRQLNKDEGMLQGSTAGITASNNDNAQVPKDKDGLKQMVKENATFKYLARFGDPKKDMLLFKHKKVFGKYDQIRAEKVEKAEAEFARTLQKINAEYTSDLLAALQEAMLAPDVAIVYNDKMLDHLPPEDFFTYEKPERLSTIMDTLRKAKLTDRCQMFEAARASVDDLLLVHSVEYVNHIMTLSKKLKDGAVASKSETNLDMYFSSGSTDAILFAAGAAIQACNLVLKGPFSYAFATVRPPGHHVGAEGPEFGFCYANNIAVAAKYALKYHGKERVLILDLDIHHGDGTQSIFYRDKHVMVMSVHRFDPVHFFPQKESGGLEYTGEGEAVGFNLNLCWMHGEVRDADYIAVWNHIVLPVVEEFDPEIIFISAGYDGAKGDPLGGCNVTPNCFAHLVQKLMSYPLVLVLEGGYGLPGLADSVTGCLKALLGDKCSKLDSRINPFTTTWDMIRKARNTFRPFFRCFQDEIPESVTSKGKIYVSKHKIDERKPFY